MMVKTLFLNDGRFAAGEVEIKLLPGIPQLHVVGMPDSHIRERISLQKTSSYTDDDSLFGNDKYKNIPAIFMFPYPGKRLLIVRQSF